MISGMIYEFGSLICHQLPSRSLLFSYQSFVCARDIGIYFGVFLGVLLMLVTRKKHPEPSLPMLVFFLPLAIDGLTEYMHLQPSSNFARVWTGLFFGIGLAFILAALGQGGKEGLPLRPTAYIISFALSVSLIPLFFAQDLFLFTFLNTVSFITMLSLIATLA